MLRAGLATEVGDLVEELCRTSPDFERMWRENHVLSHGEGENVKRLLHPELGTVEMEYSLFAVDGRPDLSMLVYTPLEAQTAARIRAMLRASVVDGAGPEARGEAHGD